MTIHLNEITRVLATFVVITKYRLCKSCTLILPDLYTCLLVVSSDKRSIDISDSILLGFVKKISERGLSRVQEFSSLPMEA